MDNQTVIDGVVRLVVRQDRLPTTPTWPDLRDEMAESQIFTLEQLDQLQEYIIEKFYQLRIERMNQDMAKLLGRPKPPKDSSNKEGSSSEGSNNDSGFNESCKESEPDEEGSFQPTVDETANEERCCFMSVCLNGRWEGTALEYCHEDESFISLRWAQRHSLEMEDGHIRLTWKFDGVDKTHFTHFILLENLEPDFMLGVGSADEVFNRDAGTPANRSSGQAQSFLEQSALPLESMIPSSTQVWVNHMVPNTEFISDILFRLERKYRHADVPESPQFYLPQHQGGIVGEDTRSSRSNASSVPNHGVKVSGPAPASSRPQAKP